MDDKLDLEQLLEGDPSPITEGGVSVSHSGGKEMEGNEYIITFDASGGECEMQTLLVELNKPYQLPTPKRAEYRFLGWYDFSGEKYTGKTWSTKMDITLYAKWEKCEYTITLDAAGGECQKKTQKVKMDRPYVLPIPKRNGYQFIGWYDLSGTKYTNALWSTPSDVTLCAEWEELEYLITLEATEGFCGQKTVTVKYSETQCTLPTATREGYIFLGWGNIANSGIVDHRRYMNNPKRNVTLYARWAKVQGEYTPVTINGNSFIYFGEWPQTEKDEGVTITRKKDSRGYCLGSDQAYYAKRSIKEGKTTIVRYFKVEPIRWRVAEKNDYEAVLVCDSILETGRFGSNSRYQSSDIRTWLNKRFFEKAFSSRQQKKIFTTEVEHETGKDTRDKVFLISARETSNIEWLDRVSLQASDYAMRNGGEFGTHGESSWWLRTTSIISKKEVRVISSSGQPPCRLAKKQGGIVPALKLYIGTRRRATIPKKQDYATILRKEDVRKGRLYCSLVRTVGVILMLIVTSWLIRLERAGIDFRDIILPATGFDTFLDFSGPGKTACIISVIVAVIIAGFVFFALGADNIDSVFWIALIGAGIGFVATRLIIVAVGYVICYALQFLFLVIAGAALVFISKIKKRYMPDSNGVTKGLLVYFVGSILLTAAVCTFVCLLVI